MTLTVVVQARMGSSRLPGKVLRVLAGRPMLEFMLDRLVGLTGRPGTRLVVATSSLPADDPIADLVRGMGLPVVRGSESDVLDRFRQATEAFPAETIVRLTADCPLSDPSVVSRTVDRLVELGADYCSNTLIRTFPDGLDVEAFDSQALFIAARHASDPAEREHVTPFIYRRPERFRLAALIDPGCAGGVRWTVDTAEDLARMQSLVPRLGLGAHRQGTSHSGDWRRLATAERGRGIVAEGPFALWPAVCVPEGSSPLRLADLPPTEDPGARVFILTRGEREVAWMHLPVRTGEASVVIADARTGVASVVDGDTATAALGLLAHALRLDQQVVRATVSNVDPSALDAGALGPVGYTVGASCVRWERP